MFTVKAIAVKGSPVKLIQMSVTTMSENLSNNKILPNNLDKLFWISIIFLSNS